MHHRGRMQVQQQMTTTTASGAVRPPAVPARVVAVVAASAAGLYWAYAPSFQYLWWTWWNNPNYSHGFFVAPIALAILWNRRDRLDPARLRPAWAGLAALAAVLAARAYLYERNEQWFETATIPLAVAALALAFGGWRVLWWGLPAFAFLYFMLPMPDSVNGLLALQLQGLATAMSTGILQAMGLPALAEGHVIYVGPSELEVAAACNGLSMLLTFLTLIAAVILLADLGTPEKVALALCAVPIALVSNVLRIVATAWAYYRFGPETVVLPGWTIGRLTHDPAGWAMMPVALGLVWLVLRLLSWMVVEEEAEPDGPAVVLPTAAARPAAAKKS